VVVLAKGGGVHPTSYDLCRQFVAGRLDRWESLRVADVGAADVNGCYRPLFDAELWEYVGFDVGDAANVDVDVVDAEAWQIPDALRGSFDVVISGQVLEHVRRPWRWIHDVVSLVRPGGLVWVCAPNTFQFHEYPIDCWRVWPDGLRALFEDAGLTEIACDRMAVDTYGTARKPEGVACVSSEFVQRIGGRG
jgi:SAM-dependent methyltransferase